MSLRKIIAFTMTEVLLVLAIIGVTAALTIPKLNADIEERKVIAALRKSYSELEATYYAIVETYGKPSEWGLTNINDLNARMGTYFAEMAAVSKNCGTGSGCFSGAMDTNNGHYKFIMKDGSSVAIRMSSLDYGILQNDIEEDARCKGTMGYFQVDVNGPFKGENEHGKDNFWFYMCYVDGLVPDSTNNPGLNVFNYDATALTGWALEVGNRDYMKCELNWITKRTCD